MAPIRTIIFGATGGVASVVARTAQEQGAKVFLALRSTQKPIPGLSPEQEKAGGYERVEADLTKPETVQAAASKTQATQAFIYLAHASTDHMKSSLLALKSAGVEFVVFLSSSEVRGEDLSSIPQSDYIASSHAQVEINLADIFGERGFVAVRPAYFASNALRWAADARAGEIKVLYPDATFDWITPGDIGRVAGTLVAGGRSALDAAGGKNSIFLFGPQIISQRDAVAAIGRATGKDFKVVAITEEEAIQGYKAIGVPEHLAKTLVDLFGKRERGEYEEPYEGFVFEEAAGNIEKYAGTQPTRFEEWVRENKQAFLA